ncbi:adenine phosphoribosyltransferase [Kribbella sp. NPDC055071]
MRSLEQVLTEGIRDIPDYPQPGVVFKDITPLLGDHGGFAQVVEALAAAGRDADGTPVVDKVVGIEARGFILAAPVALALGAGFVPVRKKGKLPAPTYEESYALEYGEATIEVHQDAFTAGERVLVIDDVLATGGTVEACLRLIRRCGAEVVGTAVLLELSFLPGRKRLADEHLTSLVTV